MRVPDVTVVVGVYNAMPYLQKCLQSLEMQTLGPHRMEVVVVDDGSTDSGGAWADAFAAGSRMRVTVVHQENSGGPAQPRNRGLDLARGRYVFFLDADDHLGPEALERMAGTADRNATDVVVGRITGVGRRSPQSVWAADLGRTDLFSSRVLATTSAEKLFRREMLERHRIRFRETLHHGEDTCFTLEAYIRADGISVVADYPCVYIVGRDDGGNLTRRGSMEDGFVAGRAQMDLISRLIPEGPERDRVMLRPFRTKVLKKFGPRMRKEPEEVWQRCFDLADPLLKEHLTPGVMEMLRPLERVRMHFIAEHRADLLRDVLTVLPVK